MLEIRVPSCTHEQLNRLLHDLFTAIAVEMDIEFLNAGSTTFTREGLRRGFEPDTCFYVQNVERVWGKTQLDLAVDPPPDVVVEIDMTHPSLNKLPIYAAVGVPEIWRYNGQALTLLKLEGDTYHAQAESTALSGVGEQSLSQFLEEGKAMKRTEWLRRVRAWALTQRSV
jgi:Uma2 family endonuclease